MLIFLDCEFTDLIPGNKLISIALVAEDGKYFYAELTDTYQRSECSDFVMNVVLPLLRGGEYKMTHSECALQIAKWIEELGVDCMLACDNISWDLPHINCLLNKIGLWPANLSKPVNGKYFKFQIMDHVIQQIVEENNFDIHNALDDARVMMLANKMGEAWEY